MSNTPPRAYTALLLTTAFIWGLGFIATQTAIDSGFGTAGILAFRFLAAAVILAFIFRKSLSLITYPDVKIGFSAGFLLFSAFFSQTLGLKYTTPANNAFITSTYVILVPFCSWFAFKKKPQTKVFGAAALCFFGIVVLTAQSGFSLSFNIGDLLTLCSAVLYAIHTVYLGAAAAKMDSRLLTFLQISGAAFFSVLSFLLLERDFSGFTSPPGAASVIYLAVFSTCLAYIIQTSAQKHLSASKVAVILSTESLFAALASLVFGYDPFSFRILAGGALVTLSLIWLEMA